MGVNVELSLLIKYLCRYNSKEVMTNGVYLVCSTINIPQVVQGLKNMIRMGIIIIAVIEV